MAVLSEHFLGFDPTLGFPPAEACPRLDPAANIVWFEKWIDTGWTYGNLVNTGIVYNRCYASFDELGHVISVFPRGGIACHGWSANITGSPLKPPPTPEAWLAEARARMEKWHLPMPGTIELAPEFRQIVGIDRPNAS